MEDDGIDVDVDVQTSTDSTIQNDVPCSETGQDPSHVASQPPEKSDLDVTGLKGQIRLAELLKVIVHNKRMGKSSQKNHHQQEDAPGPSCQSLCNTSRPLRKAKYSWQVKNHIEQKGKASTSFAEGGSLLMEAKEEGLCVDAVSTPIEPPPKKVKLSNDVDGCAAAIYTKETNTAAYHHQSSTTLLKDESTSLLSKADQLDSSCRTTAQTGQVPETQKEEQRSKSQQSDSVIAQSAPSTPSRVSQQTGVFARWQGRHIAQSIVDNAINATLEVLGFSFASDTRNPTQTISAAQRQNLEDDAVSVVIQARGLQGTDTVGDIGSDSCHNLILNNPEQRTHTAGEIANIAGHSSCHLENGITYDPQAAGRPMIDPQETRSSLLEPILSHLRQLPETAVDKDDSVVASVPVSKHPVIGDAHCEEATDKGCDDYDNLDNLFTPALQTDVLNKAVSAAISQKGLAMDATL